MGLTSAAVLLVAAGCISNPVDGFLASPGSAGVVGLRGASRSPGAVGVGGFRRAISSSLRRMEFAGEASRPAALQQQGGTRARRNNNNNFKPAMQAQPTKAEGGEGLQQKVLSDGSSGASAVGGGGLGGGSPGPGGSPEKKGDDSNLSAWLAVAILLGINIHNQWSRALIYYIVDFKSGAGQASQFINIDLGFDEAQYSLLASFAFTGLFTATSLFAGRAADLFDRAKVITAAAAVWSAATAATGLAASFDNVAAIRGIQGVSQAFVGPQAYGLIANKFKGEGLATANSVYASGVYVGGALASLSILMNAQLGWRETNFAVGGIGIVVAALGALTLRDSREESARFEADRLSSKSKRDEALPLLDEAGKGNVIAAGEDGEDEDGLAEALEAVKTVLGSRFVQFLFLASAFRFCAGYGIGVWKAPFFREAFPTFTSEFSVANAFIISGGGIMSSILGGMISDKFSPQDQRVQLWVPAVGSLLAVPLWFFTVHSASFYDAMALLFLEYIVAECWFGPVLASLYKAVPKEVQGTAQGLFTVLTAVGNLMPVLIGSMQKDYPIADVLGYGVGAAYVLSGVFFFVAGQNMPEQQAISNKEEGRETA